MNAIIKNLCLTFAVIGLAACNKGGNSPAPSPAPPAKSQTTPEKQPDATTSSDTNNTSSPTSQQIATAQQPKDVADLEALLPAPTPVDTVGGQILVGYLQGRIPGEEAVRQTMGDAGYLESDLAEMSLATNQLKQEGRYTPTDRENVKALGGAMTMYLQDRIKFDRKMEAAIDYGAAVALGVTGGIYSNEVIGAVKWMGGFRIVSVPIAQTRRLAQYLMGKGSDFSSWLQRGKNAIADSGPVNATANTSKNIFNRTVGLMSRTGNQLSSDELVTKHISKVLSSPQLAEGFDVVAAPPEELDNMQRLRYFRTGITGFRISQREGENFLVGRLVGKDGQFEYFYVRGQAIATMTNEGKALVVPPKTMTNLIASRLQNWGSNSLTFVTNTGRRIKTGVSNTRAFQYVSTSPRALRIVQGTAVGAPIGVMTLLALRPINFTDLTLEDYVRNLSDEGIDVENFLDQQRDEVQAAAQVPKNAP